VKFTLYFQILSERLGDASFLPIFGIGLATVLVIAFLTCRWGAGFLMAFPYVLIALVMSSNEEVSGVGLLSQYAFAGIMVVYALFARSTSFRWSPVNGALLVLAGFMVLNSTRSTDLQGFGLSAVYVLFFVGLIVGGQKALGTERGRRVYAKSTMFFLAVIMLMQIPDLARGRALMEGTFSSRVGIMLLGVGAAIMSFWWALRRRLFSRTFFACIPIGVLSIFCMLLTAGRTALGCTFSAILVLLVRRVGRNLIIALMVGVPAAVLIGNAAVSFTGFDRVMQKFRSGSLSGRDVLWANALRDIMNNPVVGMGTGRGSAKAAITAGTEAHNTYLAIGREQGIPIALMILVVYTWLPLRSFLLMRRVPTEEMKDMAQLSMAFLVAVYLHSMFAHEQYTVRGILATYPAIALQEGVWSEHRRMIEEGTLPAGDLEWETPALQYYDSIPSGHRLG
jgi:hypothetical protein